MSLSIVRTSQERLVATCVRQALRAGIERNGHAVEQRKVQVLVFLVEVKVSIAGRLEVLVEVRLDEHLILFA